MVPPEEFDTILAIDPFLAYTNDKKASTLYYPFDKWVHPVLNLAYLLNHDRFNSFVSLLAINPADNSTIPISGVIGYGTIVGWNAYAIFYAAVVGQEILYSINLLVWRQAMIRAFVILLAVTNCKQFEFRFNQ